MTNQEVIPQRKIFNIESTLFEQLAAPMPGMSTRVNGTKLRKLYLQSMSQQWNPTDKLVFSEPEPMPEKLRDIWIRFGTIFYTLEEMGLHTLNHMMGAASNKLASDDVAFYLSTQCADEARHVFLIEQYLSRLGARPHFDRKFRILSRIASQGLYRVENWMFSTLFSENFASAFLRRARSAEIDGFGQTMCAGILKDEHRHIHFLNIVLPDVIERLNLVSRTYIKTSQFFIMKFTEHVSRCLEEDGKCVGIPRQELLEEAFENMKKTYESFGVGRDFLVFPSIRSA
ncbi:MAG: ferritin-like domain-containing protein [Bdellovibrionales bacterium]|nr:ferritin-like domain-containing protein [Bdellovibrionales bacterium]